MREQDFKKLVGQLQSGDTSCLKFIFEEHSEYCISNLRRKMGCSLPEAEDIFMDAIINFRERAIVGKITYMNSIRNYLYATCLNMQKVSIQTKIRREGKQQEVAMYFQGLSGQGTEEQEAQEAKEALIGINMSAFKTLGQRCQQILSWFYVDQLKMDEIAEKLGLANANVAKTTKSRCYKKWMQTVKEMQESNDKNIND